MNSEFEKQLERRPMRQAPAAWRSEILAAAHAARTDSGGQGKTRPAGMSEWLAVLLWPSPKAWAGLAAAWVMILGVNRASSNGSAGMADATASPGPDIIRMVEEQRRVLAQLADPDERQPSEPPKKAFVPRPRGERSTGMRRG